ncbi:RagB/SusD family nutrient uptake outer membrane protein [Flavobacteriaceae bacterium TP-CH-4]|uniref:RagB/SusD family nutrient uptake outer membrane protein n=1 Tax=Pelagihabitans pacificus TaxID=2696054 RepID=A0A967EF78_9FLAO|nr:RagB/SusD family nutrient uptake outer membrane protein [Pelagihabitans pacificus]NHF61113.1 RagB/SusD family nutrient uptake outer membrane protein [Pelagihabitans pacificus]
MKSISKIKKFTGIALGVLMLGVSCSDEFLEVAPTGSLGDAQLQTVDGIEGLLIGTYAAVNGVFGNRFEGPNHWVTGSIMGGEANKGTDAGDYSSINPVQRYEADPTQGDLNNLWRGRYEGVSRANKVLATLAITEVPEATANRIAGEARLLRGHFYFDLKKHFNSIPYFDETALATDIPLIPNTPDVWDKIEADFQFAYDNLPGDNGAGRVNKWAAAAYMGKAKLFQQKWAEAKTWFDDVIANGTTSNGLKYALLDDYSAMFNAVNDNHAEAVMDVESSNETGSTQNANYFDDLNYPYNTGPDGPGNCCGFFQPSFELANSFRTSGGLPLLDGSYNQDPLANDYGVETSDPFTLDAGPVDPRLDHSVGRRGIPYLGWGPHPGKAWIRSQPYAGPYSPKKYVYRAGQDNTFTDGSSWTRGYATMNYMIMRYADVLLMAAEAEVELGNLDQALDYVNQVRRRAANAEFWVKNDDGSDAANYEIAEYTAFPSQEFARQAVRFERKLELSGEGHRFFDLVRWGVAAEELNAYLAYESTLLVTKFGGASFTAGKNEYYPIPQAQIDIQGSDVLSQNPGY